ncbi:MAG TPA: DUF6788 family protein [Dehalococcoidia bacterium]|nr:DUF6788 family protein [Dehalococcoidia bacterium]HYM70213.1 DUF6788 family protein [bacterium]
MLRDAMHARALQGAEVARLRQRTHALIRRFRLPAALAEMLPGSLTRSETRCGRPGCHCAAGPGHPAWTLSFTVKGRKRTERVPQEWAEEVARRVEAGRALQEAVRDVLAANAERFVWARKRRRQ